MANNSLKRLVILLIFWTMVVSPLTAMHSDAGSVINHSASDFENGTGKGTIVIPDGVKLGVEKEYLNNWTMLDPGEPGVRYHAALPFDEVAGEFALFGTDDNNWALKSKIWTYNLTTEKWKDMMTWAAPYAPPHWGMILSGSMVYDNVHQIMIAFGPTYWEASETWIYNLTSNQLSKKNPPVSPSARFSYAMAFDRDLGEVILFGGHQLTPPTYAENENPPHYNDTWTYNVSTDTWINASPINSPPGLCNASMVYDEKNHLFVLFGGRTDGLSDATWVYNRSANNWNEKKPITAPSPRQRHGMVYDPVKGETLLYGGCTPVASDELWAYNLSSNSWTLLDPSVRPPKLAGQSMGYDRVNNKIVLYGGADGYDSYPKFLVDTWIYNSTANNWTIRRCKSPQPRGWSEMAYDESSGEIVLFGGGNGLEHFFDDTWTFNLSTKRWTNKDPLNPPKHCYLNGMVYDSTHAEILLIGVRYGDANYFTYSYNHTTNTWMDRYPSTVFKPDRHYSAVAFDKKADRTILFGGCDPNSGQFFNETWSYDYSNNTWTNLKSLNAPPPRSNFDMVYLESSSELLIYGGRTYQPGYMMLNDTWRYNYTTNTWTNVTKSITPNNNEDHTMCYDKSRDEALLMGGRYGGPGNETWCFSPTTNEWKLRKMTNLPSATAYSMIVYDSKNNETILFGGYTYYQNYGYTTWSSGFFGETWALNHRVLYKEGNHTSQPIDLGGPANFWTLDWSSDVPEGTGLRLQLRTAETDANLQAAQFVGPDGTNETYYNVSGLAVSEAHNGSRWIQYKAYLNTTYDLISPVLKSVNITYNLLPEMPVLEAPLNGQWTNSSRPTFSWTPIDNDSTIAGFELQMDDSLLFDSVDHSSGQVVSTELSYQPTASIADGIWYWRVRTLDSDGDWGPFSGSRILRVDTGPPGPFEIVADPPGWTNGTIQLTFNTTDSAVGMGSYEVEIDAVSQGVCESPFELPILSDGDHEITVKAYDLLWNNISSTVTVFQDRTPPLAFVPTGEPPGWTNTSPRILFETTDAASGVDWYGVAIDDGASTCQTSPFILPTLADGIHNITVRAYDIAGNYVDGRVTVFLDSVRPFNFSVSSDWAGWTNQDPTLTFQALDNVSSIDHYEVKVPGKNFTVQTSPCPIQNLTDGQHNITIRAYDKASNYVEATIELFIDKSPPANFTPIADPATCTNQDPNITFSTADNSSGVSRFDVGLKGGNLTTRTSPFRFTNLPEGRQQIVVRAYDAAGNYADGTVNVFFDETPPTEIFLKINDGEKLTDKRKVTLSIMATDNLSKPGAVCFSNDGNFYSTWEPFNNSKAWNLSKDQGSKTVYMQVRDEAGNIADPVLATIKYVPSSSGGNTMFLVAILVLIQIIAAAVVAVSWKYARRKEPESTPLDRQVQAVKERPTPAALEMPDSTRIEEHAEPPKEEIPTPGLEVEQGPPAVDASIAPLAVSTVTPAPAEEKAMFPPVSEKPFDVMTASLLHPSTIGTTAITAPAGFAVEDIFLTYRDGRLVMHTTRRLKADMDVDIMTSMLTAVQEFIKESFGKAEGQELGSMEFGESKILLQKGKFIALAAVIEGPEAPGFRDEMKAAVNNIESEFGSVLPKWDGTVQKLAGVKRFLAQLGAYKPAEAPSPEAQKGEVSLKSELEFYQGFVRLKVAVKNSMKSVITHVGFKIIYDKDTMRLDHVEPELQIEGADVQLGIVGPREKKSVAFYLDPQICTESYLEGILNYKDAEGNLETIKMPRKMASVVCPILFTDENINTAMLKRMATEELDKKDTKVFSVPALIGPQKAFEIAKAAIQHHDLRLVRELKNERPFEAEAWYYGKAKGREDKVIVRARVIADKNFLEFFVASNSILMLTGMLAELKSDLNKEIEIRKVRMGMKQVTDQKEVDAMTTIRTLLEKATESEIDAGETEAR